MPHQLQHPQASGNLPLHHRALSGGFPAWPPAVWEAFLFYTLPLKHNIPALLYVTLLDTYSSVTDIKVAEEPMCVEPWNRASWVEAQRERHSLFPVKYPGGQNGWVIALLLQLLLQHWLLESVPVWMEPWHFARVPSSTHTSGLSQMEQPCSPRAEPWH